MPEVASHIVTIDVTFHIIVDPRTKAEEIVPEEEDLERLELDLSAQEEAAEIRLQHQNAFVREQAGATLLSIAETRVWLKRRREASEVLRPHCETRTYELKRPEMEVYLLAEDKAKKVTPELGIQQIDNAILMRDLLPKAMKPEDRKSAPPNIQAALWRVLHASLWGDPNRLVFVARGFTA